MTAESARELSDVAVREVSPSMISAGVTAAHEFIRAAACGGSYQITLGTREWKGINPAVQREVLRCLVEEGYGVNSKEIDGRDVTVVSW